MNGIIEFLLGIVGNLLAAFIGALIGSLVDSRKRYRELTRRKEIFKIWALSVDGREPVAQSSLVAFMILLDLVELDEEGQLQHTV